METKVGKKLAIITGGTGNIGYCLSKGYLEAGYNVFVLDYEEHQRLPEGIVFIRTDLEDTEDVECAFKVIDKHYGKAHVLINNAAISTFNKPIEEMTINEFDQVIGVNLRGTFICSKLFIEFNKGESFGRIINIASTRCLQNECNWEAYGASKGGVVALTNSLCVSLSTSPITVNAISPGWIQAKGYETLTEVDHRQHPSGRVGKPEDVLRACLFLCEEQNDFINGHNLVIDGGMTKKMIYQD